MGKFNKQAQERLDELYKLYPRKQGKSQGYKTALTQCPTLEDMALLEKAIVNYMIHLTKQGTEKEYVLYFKTFMNQWRDWLDPDHGSITLPSFKVLLEGVTFDPE